ncbi:uncharacterized protein [Clytia hemisphaerica]|uniref:DDB1- and CUL4-associated factor 15 WD40 repeat-containing domain-containing protein n=2 Tax=Clytia hemisphaerica TaxID=252671 RepID=A0A7M5WT94_9CNID
MCYVSIVPKYNKKKPEQNQYSVHFKYELLPPHPPFLTTISLKRKNVILLNSGDMLFAILIPEPSSLFSCESGKDIQTRLCYCQQRQQDVLANQSNIDVNYDDSTDYISFINQGFNTINDNDSQTSLPDSPFDCMTTVIPCAITTVDGLIQLKNSYEHRCFRHADKGEMSKCDFFVNQAQLDAENFMNTELQKREDISKRFVSLKDYDMQFIEFCTEDDSAIILINALVVLRNTSKPRDDTATNNPEPSSTKFDLFEEQKSMKLVLYTVGYILAWNIFTGEVKVLRELPITERPSNYCKPRNFAPSFSQSTQLRKKWFVPSSKTSSISVLSNHTVLTGKSVQFLFHPEFPVAIVL